MVSLTAFSDTTLDCKGEIGAGAGKWHSFLLMQISVRMQERSTARSLPYLEVTSPRVHRHAHAHANTHTWAHALQIFPNCKRLPGQPWAFLKVIRQAPRERGVWSKKFFISSHFLNIGKSIWLREMNSKRSSNYLRPTKCNGKESGIWLDFIFFLLSTSWL